VTSVAGAARALVERIHREGPVPFDVFVEESLYGDGGFFTRGGGAGRAGRDFVTSPEVGPLFGAVVARALDGWWDDLGREDPFLVVDAGAGRGRLATDVLAAAPRCAKALRYVLVERSAELRAAHRDVLEVEPAEDVLGPAVRGGDDAPFVQVTGVGPIVTSLAEMPAAPMSGVVVANELLDNLPFRVVERAEGGWVEVRISHDGDRFVESPVPATPEVAVDAGTVAAGVVPVGARLPVPVAARQWLHAAAGALRRGVLAVVDYTATAPELVERGQDGWLRTYLDQARGRPPLDAPGEQDITADVPVEFLVHAAARAGFTLERETTQAEWLRDLGIDELVAEARTAWDARSHVGDLEALRHRSRVGEAAALTDPTGLGAHHVLVFRK
jgi:SAM-dependent MidA family methyltransferase